MKWFRIRGDNAIKCFDCANRLNKFNERYGWRKIHNLIALRPDGTNVVIEDNKEIGRWKWTAEMTKDGKHPYKLRRYAGRVLREQRQESRAEQVAV